MNFKCSIKSSHSYVVVFLKGENKGLAWQQKQLVHVASRLRAIRISQKSVCIKHVAIETDTLSASGLPQHHYNLIWLLMLHSGQISLYWSWFHHIKKTGTVQVPFVAPTYHQCMLVRRQKFDHLHSFSTNDITLNWYAVLGLLKRDVDCPNFVILSYLCMPVLEKKLKWPLL